MKRFLSALLTLVMLVTLCPAAIAEEDAGSAAAVTAPEEQDGGNFVAPEEKTPDPETAATLSAEGEGEAENEEISLLADDEVQYSTDGGSNWTSSSLSDAVTAIGTGTGTIKVQNDVTVSAEIKITGNVTLIADGKDVTIKRANTLTDAPVISVASGATLNLGTETAMENTLTIDGGAVWNGNDGYPNTDAAQSTDKSNNTGVRGNFAIIRTDGTFNMYENVILQNNHNNTSVGSNHSGGGVDIENAGVFNMYGGKIWKCSSASQAEWGGGVTVAGLDYELATPATFNLYGGEICYNTAGIGGGVSVGNPNSTHDHPAIFNMYNGNIHHNKAGSMDAYSGAGVYVADNAVFTMEDGSITENTAEAKNGYALGGGVESVGTFNMSGGTISGNTAKSGGAGIFLMYNDSVDCTANITGGNIINNNGEGIFINDTKAYLNISGNVNISGNTKTGIYIEKNASPINVAETLTVGNTMDVNSAITDDGTVIVTFADGLNASDYTNTFKHASKSMIVKENKLVIGVQTYAVTVTDPIYMPSSFPGITPDSKIGTISVTGADDLTAVPADTDLTLAITVADDTNAKNHTFVKWVVKTESGTEVTVTDNKFTMPGEAVTVTAEYVPDIQMTFYAGGTYASTTNECKDYTWNDDGTVTYTMPGNKGTLTISTPNGFKQWTYPSTDTTTKTPTVTANDVVTVTVNINESYIFNGIKSVTSQSEKLNGSFDNSGAYTFSVPVGTYRDYAGYQNAFIILDIRLNALEITTDIKNGTISGITSPAVIGSDISFTLAPEDDTYKLDSCKVFKTGDEATTVEFTENNGTYTFKMPEYAVTVSAVFVKKTHAVTITKDGEGTVTINPKSPVEVGQTVNVTATPDEHWELSSLTMNDADITSAKSFTMPNGAVELKAVFVKKQFDVTVEETEHGKVSCDEKDTKVDWGTDIDFTVKPDDYYDIDTVTVNGETVTPDEDGNYTFTSEAKDSTIKATFKKQQFALTDATTETNGTVSIMSGSTDVNNKKLDWGTSVTVTVAPKENWEIDEVTINGKDISNFADTVLHTMSLLSAAAPTTYTVLIPTYDAKLVVTYKKTQFTVTAEEAENGKITIVTPPNGTIEWGETVSFTVQPNDYYVLNTLTVDGLTDDLTQDEATGGYRFKMPTNDVSICATFRKKQFTVTTNTGFFTVEGINGSYDWGEEVTFTVTPNRWYNIKSVSASGIEISDKGDGKYSFTMPTSSVQVVIETERPVWNIVFDSQGGSSVTSTTVQNGEKIEKPYAPTWVNRGFAGWYTDAACTVKYDFDTEVTANTTLYARWFLWGDVTGDGQVDSRDALLIQRCYVGLADESTMTIRMAAFTAGVGRSNPDSRDALTIQRKYVGMVDVFPVEAQTSGYEFDLEHNTYIPGK